MNIRLTMLLFLLGCLPALALADYPIEIIELKGRTVEEVIPLVKPFAGPDGAVTGMHDQLIIRTSPERLQDIRKILARIDRPPRRLMIHVRQGRITDADRTRISAGVNLEAGAHAKAEMGDRTQANSVRLRARNAQTRSDLDVTQRIQTIEGKPAFIATGRAIPIQEQSTYISGGVIQQQNSTRYRDTTTGFYVIPRLSGDRVTLQIGPHMERPGQIGGTFDIQQVRTTLSGRLGEWIFVGGVEQDAKSNSTGALHRHSTISRDEGAIQLLVEELP